MSAAAERGYIAPGAVLGAGVSVGHGAVIHDGARIGEGTVIGTAAVIYGGVDVGERCLIEDPTSCAALPSPFTGV